MDLVQLKKDNLKRWDDCHIPAEKGPAFKQVAERLSAAPVFSRYKAVEKLTGVPWWFIAVVHEREGAQKWDTYLGNGQALDKKTTLVPKGRGPFKTWEDGAVDALVNCAPFAAKNKDWSIGGALTMLELYNGPGYAQMNKPSPYVWAGTNQYEKGKYVGDGKYSPETVDAQLGCAGLLKFMGVFKTAPTGVGTAAAVVVIGSTTAVAAVSSTNHWAWFTDHWAIILIAVIGAGILIDLGLSIYNNEKNRLKVTGNKEVSDVAIQ
jgi:lysozyme family protein